MGAPLRYLRMVEIQNFGDLPGTLSLVEEDSS